MATTEIVTLHDLYEKIRQTYNSPWFDEVTEINQCYQLLKDVLPLVSVETLIRKARAAALAHGSTKLKTSRIIQHKYWELTYPSEPMPVKIPRYNPNQL